MICVLLAVIAITAFAAGPWKAEMSKEVPVGTHPGGWPVGALITQLIGLFTLAALGPSGWIGAAVLAVFMAPWLFTHLVLVPLGWPRAAFWLGRTATFSWANDPVGAGLVAAALATIRSGTVASADWIDARVQAQSPLLPGGVLASGLMAFARGDHERARRIITFLGWFPGHRVPDPAWKIAREWLVLDAASRGEWATAARLGASDGRARSTTTEQVARAAERMVAPPGSTFGAPLPARGTGMRRDLEAELVRRIREADGRPATVEDEAPEVAETSDALSAALVEHVLVARATKPSAAAVRRLIARWEAVTDDPAFSPRLAMRAGELGARDPMEQRKRFLAEVADELREMAVAAGLASGEVTLGGGSSESDRLREQALSDLEVATTALRRRVTGERDLPGIDELGEFLEVARLYERVARVAGLATQRLVFRQLQDAGTDQAVRLFNVRKERAIANAIFRYLVTAANTAGDARAAELSQKNAACGC